MRVLSLSHLPRRVLSRLRRLLRGRWINLRRRLISLPLWKAKRRIRRMLHGPDGTPLVSVIIPVHNAAETLDQTLQSLAVQRIRDWEAIVVDDGSTDSTPEVIASWQARDPRIRPIRQAQSGVSRARNTGLLHAGAERVMFLDADDWIAPDYFERMFAALAENPGASVVYCGYVRISDDGWQLPMSFSWELERAPFETFAGDCAAAIHCMLLRRRDVLQVGAFDPDLKTCEDHDLWQRITRLGGAFVGVPLPLAFYRMRSGSATGNYTQMIKDNGLVLTRTQAADLRVKRPDPRYINGLPADDEWVGPAYAGLDCAIWCAAVEAANGRTGLPALDVFEQFPDMKEHVERITGSLIHGLSVGARRPRWALTDVWRAAEPRLVEICERIESASTRPGLARCLMENLETLVMRECGLATPQTLWRMRGYRVNLPGPIPDIEATPPVDNLYLRIGVGKLWLEELCYPLLGPIASSDLARMVLEDWGLDGCLARGPASTRLQLIRTVAADVSRRIGNLLRSRKDRRSQLLDIIRVLVRGLCASPFLTAAAASPATSKPESVHGKPVAASSGPLSGASTGRGPCSTLVSDNNSVPELEARSSAERREIWDQNFETPDPWDYASPYEQEKYQRTLALLPDEPIEQAMEIACAEGVFTSQLAPRVKSLIAVDISERALERARDRCAAHANVRFQYLDLVEDAIPGQMDLIVCSEVLYFLKDVDELRRIAEKLKSALVPGGRLVAAHAFLLADDPQNTGFDWMSHFGGKTIDRIISETPGLHREKSIVTELYRIDVYRHDIDGAARPLPDIQHLPLEAPLDPKIEKQIVWGGAYLRRSEALRSEVTDRVPILMYHRVSDTGVPELARYRVDPWAFEQQLRFLRQHGYHSVTANDLLAAIRSGEPLRGRPIMLTFDDAYRDFYETAWPLLQKYDFTADVFVVTDKVAGCADWDSSYGEPAPLMTWDEIETLEAEGIVFGSHLATHRAADCLSTVELLHEGESSRLALETRLGENVRAIAFPFGIHNRRVVNTLKLCGYEIGVTTEYGIAAMWMDPMTLPRVEVEGSDDLATFAWKIERNHTS